MFFQYYTVIDWVRVQQQFCLTRGRIRCPKPRAEGNWSDWGSIKLLLFEKPVKNCFLYPHFFKIFLFILSWEIITETYNRLVMLRWNAIYYNKRNRQRKMHQSLAICVRQQSLINKTFWQALDDLYTWITKVEFIYIT